MERIMLSIITMIGMGCLGFISGSSRNYKSREVIFVVIAAYLIGVFFGIGGV